jgi:8-oxo-dGTP pyrophosphatase MutT (NUDIX family)
MIRGMGPCGRIFTGRVVTLDVERVPLPNGREAELEIVGHPGGAATVALDGRGHVCLLRQYRHVAGGWLWEIPGGKLDGGRLPEQVARAELAEEAGFAAQLWQPLGRYLSSPGVFREVVSLFLARDLTPCARAPEPDEVVEVHWRPFAEALRQALNGEIVDGKTVVALARADALLRLEARHAAR